MTENRMYSQRVKNIPVMRYCGFNCVYCAFQKFQKISKCLYCRENNIHSHLEVLQRTPPKTKEGEFITVGLSGDVSFMHISDFIQVVGYCRKWSDRTFLIQSKDPSYFVAFEENGFTFPDNVILGTTIESNIGAWWYKDQEMFRHLKKEERLQIHYNPDISKAPLPIDRYEAMLKLGLGQRKAITIEPILDFDIDILAQMIINLNPKFVWVGYDNHNHKLPEPAKAKTEHLIEILTEAAGNRAKVIEKTLRRAWWE